MLIGLVIGIGFTYYINSPAECKHVEKEQGKIYYLTEGYICDKLEFMGWGIQAINCDHMGTGKNHPIIYNPTNITEIKI